MFVCTYNVSQALGVLMMSIGFKGTVKTIIKFPTIILTAMFSIWTIGPVISTKSVCGIICCIGHQKLGVSTCLTWINLLLTLASGFAYVIWHDEGDWFGYGNIFEYFLLSCIFLAIAMIFLILLNCLDKCQCCPCFPCCESNCYPVTQFTYLDVNNIDVIITQEEIELDQL